MKGLLLKDLYIMRQNIKSLLFILVVWSVIFMGGSRSGMFLIPMFMMIAGINVINLFSYDRQSKWEAYALTMPVTRWKIVLEKYIYVVITSAVAGIMAIAAVAAVQIFKSISIDQEFLFELFINWLVGISISFFYNSLSIPLTYWLGVEKARMIPSVLLCLAVFSFVIMASRFGFLSAVNERIMMLLLMGAFIGSVVVLAVSCLVSVSVYKKKDL